MRPGHILPTLGVKMVAKRTRFLGIRVTDAEYAQLLERCDGKQLAVWMRETCLDTRPARSSRLPSMAPALLRQFAGTGNNLNQIARKINSGQWSGHDRVQIIACLMAVEAELRRLRQCVKAQGEPDDC